MNTIFANNLQGNFMDGAVPESFGRYLMIFSNVLMFLYKHFPYIAWWGWTWFALNIFCISNFLFVIVVSSSLGWRNIFISITFSILFVLSFCLEGFILMDSTIGVIFLSCSSLLALVVLWKTAKPSWHKYILGFFLAGLFYLALLIRFEVIPLSVVEAVILFIFLFPVRTNYVRVAKFFIFFGVCAISWYATYRALDNPEFAVDMKVDDRMNISENLVHQSTLNTDKFWRAVMTNRFYGDNKITTLGASIPIKTEPWINLLRFENIKRKVLTEYWRSTNLYNEYNPDLNYFGSILVLAASGLLLLFINFIGGVFSSTGFRPFVINITLFSAFWLTMLAAAIFMRADDRFLLPYDVCTIVCMLLVCLYQFKNQAAKNYILLLLSVVCITIILCDRGSIQSIVETKKLEIQHANELKGYIHNHYKGKVIIFDFWTMSLFLGDPFINSGPDTTHIQLMYGDYGSSILSPYRNKIRSLTKKSDDLDDFLKYAATNDARFLLTDDRKNLFERYSQEIYHRKFVLNAIDSTCPIYTYHFCALPYRYNFGVYSCVDSSRSE